MVISGYDASTRNRFHTQHAISSCLKPLISSGSLGTSISHHSRSQESCDSSVIGINRVMTHLSAGCSCLDDDQSDSRRDDGKIITGSKSSPPPPHLLQTLCAVVRCCKLEKIVNVVGGNYYDVIHHLLKWIGTMTGVWCFGLTNCVITARQQSCPVECECYDNLAVSSYIFFECAILFYFSNV